ncbi:protein-disulfide reductase DsbD [Massilia antarctica]|uniref:protein-disulfide reductase DsbD n=1 Tax=Massilia antarctica TaxID=2765360 RepID=UPI0006BCB878|nr:protein-disulfide reductase DsbD [Massilia sp. H27-R4]MCY0914398.1 protein-disulfide reductase DsbD [Massilia sp. H27-R4]CUI03223.1 Cytochrome c-type biogenesis protein DsbD, protein-disulfide reductase [Janthinobacterium sp. CG23_2]CUU27009.1 Cytochrome c-type biogenesis protein DsbD, protein-disulfide reductase [Janthinobacterium sp. CG23_2]
MKSAPFLRWLLSLLAMLAFAGWAGKAAAADDFLDPEQAFVLRTEVGDGGAIALRWTIAPGYHLYRDRLAFTSAAGAAPVAAPALPAGIRKFDENFNKEMETYQGQLDVALAPAPGKPFTLNVAYQGCADAGLCYAPITKTYLVDPAKPGVLAARAEAPPAAAAPQAASAPVNAAASATPPAKANAAAPEDDTTLAQRTLQSGSLWRIGSAFLLFGLLLSFTPCVLPMVPILSSIIVGEGTVSRGRGLLLASAYCLGMALVYTALGVGAGLAGEGLAGALQKPWVLLTFGALLVGLALSMFDVYQLQLPSSLQTRLSGTGGAVRGGRFVGVFIMGALSALIVGPCVAGPLAGALLYISQTGNAWIGGWALFSMALGMSVPLLLTGLSAGSLLPRAGAWMNGVKKVFGMLLIAVAIWMVSPVFPVPVMMALWGGFAILAALFLHVGHALPPHSGAGAYAGKALGVLMLVGGLFELAGAASSGRDVLQPLAHLRGGGGSGGTALAHAESGPQFTRIRTVAELEKALADTSTPVLLDFYADWCVACKEMERMTFPDGAVSASMKKMRLIQVDVTANNADDRALMKKFSLFGPPGIILFDSTGKEVPQGRIIGFVPAQRFAERLQAAHGTAG